MNYDSVIVEMLARIQALEEQVKILSGGTYTVTPDENVDIGGANKKITTSDIREYIKRLKCEAREHGKKFLTLKANDIHKSLKMKNRIPLVANAMRQCMEKGDEILHDTPSGKSSTLEIKYNISNCV